MGLQYSRRPTSFQMARVCVRADGQAKAVGCFDLADGHLGSHRFDQFSEYATIPTGGGAACAARVAAAAEGRRNPRCVDR
jgi:hypothetical protein